MKTARNVVIGAICFFTASACREKAINSSIPDEVIEVSLIQLIATPEKFDGKNVSTIGFYHGGFEGSAIYASREDALIQNVRSGIAVGGIPPHANHKHQPSIPQNTYISVSGFFQNRPGGHGGLWPGMICPTIAFSVYDQSAGEWRVLQRPK